SISNGSSIGTVRNECFGVDHTHWSYKNLVSNYSCYVNHSNASYTAGMSLSSGTEVGSLGSSNTGSKQTCINSSGDYDDFGVFRLTGSTYYWYVKDGRYPFGSTYVING